MSPNIEPFEFEIESVSEYDTACFIQNEALIFSLLYPVRVQKFR